MPHPHRRLCGLLATAGALTLLAAGTASAAPQPVLYGSASTGGGGGGSGSGGSGGSSSSPSTLYRVDPATAATTAVGPIGFQITGLAVDPTTGVLYGATGSNSASNPRSIITINKVTGAGTLVGVEDPAATLAVADITFLANGQMVGWTEESDDFVTIDKTTGAATVVSDSGVNTYGDGMSVDKNGTIFAMLTGNVAFGGELRTVDPATGLTAVVAPLSSSTAFNDGAAIPAAAFGCDRTTLYAVDGLSGSTAPDYLVTVDTTSGVVTPVAATTVRLDGLEWDCPTELGVSATEQTVGEGAQSVTVTVNRLGGTKGATSVNYATADGTATAGADYSSTSGTLTFADNETTKTITVPLLGDSGDEPDETFTVNLSNAAANATATPATQTVRITDDDPTPVVTPPQQEKPPVVVPPVRKAPTVTFRTTPSRDLRSPYRFTTKGRITLPAGVKATDGCQGKVRVTFKVGKLTVSSRLVKVTSTCRFTSRVTFRIKRRLRKVTRLKVNVRFAGNAVLLPKSAAAKRVRVR